MRIAVVTGPFLPAPPAPSGAVERIWQELAEEFASRGHSIHFHCRAHRTQRAEEVISGVRYVRRTRFVRSRWIFVDIALDFIYSLRMLARLPQADIVVTNVFWLPFLLSCFRNHYGRIVVNVGRMPKGHMFLYRGVDRLAVVSGAVRDAIAAQNPELLTKVRVIPNPIDTSTFVPAATPRAARQIPHILFVGRVHPEKGVHLLIDAMRIVYASGKLVTLRILGPVDTRHGGGGRKYLERLKHLSAGLPVDFSPPLFDKASLVYAYHEASVFCYPSLAERGESFGLAPLEAMATALAPVVSDLACFREFVSHGITGLVFNHRASDASYQLATSINLLVANRDYAEHMGLAAWRRAQDFSKERVASRYLDDFTELAKRR